MRSAVAVIPAFALTACTGMPSRAALEGPRLRLSPQTAGVSGAWQQRFEFGSDQRRMTFEALLEIDREGLQLAALSLQQVAYTLRWDGRTLTETRADWLPDGLRGAWVLDDLQLAWWPVDAIRAAAASRRRGRDRASSDSAAIRTRTSRARLSPARRQHRRRRNLCR
jgi:hypothetical protein